MGIGPTVEQQPGGHLYQVAIGVGLMAVPHACRVSLDVAGERLGSVVDHLYGTPGPQGQQGDVDVERDVLASSKGSTDPGRVAPDRLIGQVEASDDLSVIDVNPLRGDVEVEATEAVGNGQAGLGAERGLVLGRRLIETFDHNGAGGIRVSSPYLHLAKGVPAGCGHLRIGHRRQRLPFDDDGLHGTTCRLRVVGGDHGNGFTPIASLTVA